MGQSLLPCFHRDSGQPDVFFTLSYQSEDGPTSVRVQLNNLLFSLHGSQKTFTSLFALLAFYTSSPCKLTEPYRRQRPERLKQMCRRALVQTHGGGGFDPKVHEGADAPPLFTRGTHADPVKSSRGVRVCGICRELLRTAFASGGATSTCAGGCGRIRSIPLQRSSIHSSRHPPAPGPAGGQGAAAGCSCGLTEERGALDRVDRGGTEGTWGRTRSFSRP
ncbi:hypothetical protein GOODEAATRI_009484 [Goodea atripinnis]|uniref:Uncharacterized protein n=1 Tax=Goodea atripinnis TaxID=208336 RepID=A0ABV0MGQ3_9TELE